MYLKVLELSVKTTEMLPYVNAHPDTKATRMCPAGNFLDQGFLSVLELQNNFQLLLFFMKAA